MGIWQSLFGGKTASPAPSAPKPLALEEVVARIQVGAKVDLNAAFAGLDDDAEESALWTLLPHSSGAQRVEIIERLAEFELEPPRQAELVRAAVDRVPGAGFAAAAVASVCDLPALAAKAAAQPVDVALLDAIGTIIAALCEAALGQGPAAEDFDVGACAATVRDWVALVVKAGGGPADLVALELAIEVCLAEDLSDEDIDAGWDEDFEASLRAALARMLAQPPRAGGTWLTRIVAGLHAESPEEALQALTAARIADLPVREPLLERVRAQPEDEGAWSLALQLLDAQMLDVLAPLATAQLQQRRLNEGELCSPASQACCGSCGGGDKAAHDDDLMVPRALEARVLPLLGACAKTPGQHTELLEESLAAPSANLRFAAATVLGLWPAEAVPESSWPLLEALRDDSHPQVQGQVAVLLGRATARAATPA